MTPPTKDEDNTQRWNEAVEELRGPLERLAEHGETQLAEDARQLLEEVDAAGESA